MSIQEIKAWLELSENLATAGQPTVEQLGEVAAHGYEVVINLGLMDPRYCLQDERAVVAALGMDYHHIPVEFAQPRARELARFFNAMDENAGRKVLVHCAANYRVSCFVALYGMARHGWTREAALALVRRTWEPDRVWLEFIEQSIPASAALS